jgi:cobalt transporter subunit CbtB
VNMTTSTISATKKGVSTRVKAGLVCLFTGSTLVFLVGLSNISVAHNAAHDTRHAIGFPCH